MDIPEAVAVTVEIRVSPGRNDEPDAIRTAVRDWLVGRVGHELPTCETAVIMSVRVSEQHDETVAEKRYGARVLAIRPPIFGIAEDLSLEPWSVELAVPGLGRSDFDVQVAFEQAAALHPGDYVELLFSSGGTRVELHRSVARGGAGA